jgi:hypothetical protein
MGISENIGAPEICAAVVSQCSIGSRKAAIKLISIRNDAPMVPTVKKACAVNPIMLLILGAQDLVTGLGESLGAHGVGAATIDGNAIVRAGRTR